MKLTTALITAAVALYALARRRSDTAPAAPAANPSATSVDPGMVILRNEHIDDGIAVRPSFAGDPGIVRNAAGDADRNRGSI